MTREYWIGLIVVALIVGLAVGYGVWGGQKAQVAELQAKVEQLTKENTDLKAKAPASTVAGVQMSEATTPAASTTAKQ